MYYGLDVVNHIKVRQLRFVLSTFSNHKNISGRGREFTDQWLRFARTEEIESMVTSKR